MFESVKYNIIAIVAILERAVYSADSSGACTGFCNDAVIHSVFIEELSDMETLSEGFELDACAEVIEELIAVVNRIEGEDSFKEKIHAFRFNFVDHIELQSAIRRKIINDFILYILTHYYVKVKTFGKKSGRECNE